jgi:hypothetical protein
MAKGVRKFARKSKPGGKDRVGHEIRGKRK